MSASILASCVECNGRWIEISRVQSKLGISQYTAAHDCEGIAVVATWSRDGDRWVMHSACSEDGSEVEPDDDAYQEPVSTAVEPAHSAVKSQDAPRGFRYMAVLPDGEAKTGKTRYDVEKWASLRVCGEMSVVSILCWHREKMGYVYETRQA